MTDRECLRHLVATLGYRAAKALRSVPPGFADFVVAPGSRTPAQILAHMGDLFDWALEMAKGGHTWHDSKPLAWDEEVERFMSALKEFDDYLGSEQSVGWPIERLIQGPVADALTHTGQLTMLRRLAGKPIRGENYAKAEITVGNIGLKQAAPRVEFD